MDPWLFLTAFDPTDLPGTSVDPLGFESGYLALADKILPGLTLAANRPRYFSVICAGIRLAGDVGGLSPRDAVRRRREVVQRLERFWALANVLADGDLDPGAVRGVTYARARANEIKRVRSRSTDAEYLLLSRQTQYGALGIYGNVADKLRFIDRETMGLTPDLGEPLADAFIRMSWVPKAVRKSVCDGGAVSVGVLAEWGRRAHVQGEMGGDEGRRIFQALEGDPVRRRMAKWLRRHQQRDDEKELERLERIRRGIRRAGRDPDLYEAIGAILAYEPCYQWALLSFERLLWRCRNDGRVTVPERSLAEDEVLAAALRGLRRAVGVWRRAQDGGETAGFRQGQEVFADVNNFLVEATDARRPVGLLRAVVRRHSLVQGRKSKMPWLEFARRGLRLAGTRVGGLGFEATRREEIEPHGYRLEAADRMIKAGRSARRGG